MRVCCLIISTTILLLAGTALAQELPQIRLETVLTGVRNPVHLWHDGTPGKLYIVEQSGVIRIAIDGRLQPKPFLDISPQEVFSGGECGLLSVAFSPQFANDGLFYVDYTQRKDKIRTIIAQFKASSGALTVSPDTQKVILTIDQPFPNHKGGHVIFGPDGMLYIGMGDGGAANDPFNNAQNPDALLGKILRIKVGGKEPYEIPPDNPFVSDKRFRPEIWALGMRNPWRMCFDPDSGLMLAADVGQDKYEEIDVVKAGGNYGWRPREGLHPNPNLRKVEEPISPDTDPILEYTHRVYQSAARARPMPDNCIIGGFVYRGRSVPSLVGWYLYADYTSGRIWALKQERGVLRSIGLLLETATNPSGFGEDADGELYVCDHIYGAILRVAAKQ